MSVDAEVGPTNHHRDLDSTEEIVEMVTRQYVDVVQDDLLAPYFQFGPGFMDWQAHIGNVGDFWSHVLLYAPDYDIEPIEHHRPLHERDPFTPELFDRCVQIFYDTVDGGWTGPRLSGRRSAPLAWLGRWRRGSSAAAHGAPQRHR